MKPHDRFPLGDTKKYPPSPSELRKSLGLTSVIFSLPEPVDDGDAEPPDAEDVAWVAVTGGEAEPVEAEGDSAVPEQPPKMSRTEANPARATPLVQERLRRVTVTFACLHA